MLPELMLAASPCHFNDANNINFLYMSCRSLNTFQFACCITGSNILMMTFARLLNTLTLDTDKYNKIRLFSFEKYELFLRLHSVDDYSTNKHKEKIENTWSHRYMRLTHREQCRTITRNSEFKLTRVCGQVIVR